MAIYFVEHTIDIEWGFNVTTKCPRIERLTRGVGLRISLAAMNQLLRVGMERSKLRTSILGIEDPMETCTKYCSRVSSAGDIGRLCSFSVLVGKVIN
ncbi:UNVERIFIED_CONTAM: hypothetical protein Sangu_3118400 [Sesamum angustifolium]|uniref:Uncharacterized protein n=1 Tax=Sesamum angustifolium TaxID=2727405 RepID=A0AAW2K3S2_9LAMI